MIEKGKISAYQLGLLIYPTIYATAVLFVPAVTGKYAGRDMWLSPILGSITGFITALILYRLHKSYPDETIIQYSKHIIGRKLSFILSFLYIFFFLFLCGFIMREYATFIITSFLPRTPLIVIIVSFVLVCAVAVSGGVEVLGRAANIFVPLFIFPIPIFVLLLTGDMDLKNALPILEDGLKPAILGAVSPHGWFSEVFLISMLLPYVGNREKGLKWTLISIVAVITSLVSLNLMCIFLFGEITASYTYPVFKAIRYISVSEFFEHLEAAIISVWIIGAFVKMTVFYYALVLGTAQWLQLSDYKPIVLPLGFIITLFSIWEFDNLQEQIRFSETVFPFYVPFMLTLIPFLLLVIDWVRKGWRRNKDGVKRKLDIKNFDS
ncbi:endospore germination permease [Bacillus sp. V5-8f]|uniref:GerAB/ArcD/ProY family transporter n=1 Tax=Bacillus sp. V5-8f TaxID=2053044 RepID=UPI000C77E05A|nr:endospore germination permease [Bacillus sp. V5-8f]PLT35415.1 spore gernimation protein [Bacillus sp. V5-8f]